MMAVKPPRDLAHDREMMSMRCFASFALAVLAALVPLGAQADGTCSGGTTISGPSGAQSQPFEAGAGAACANNTASFAIDQTITTTDSVTGSAFGLHFFSAGPAGANAGGKADGGNGGNSGFLQATNSGSITVNGAQSAPVVGLLLTAAGGNGGNAIENGYFGGAGGSDGGGISTGSATTNGGAIILVSGTNGSFAGGATGFRAYSTGGQGGLGYTTSDDSLNAGGGPGGSGNFTSVVNAASGTITIGAANGFAIGGIGVWGLSVVSAAGEPGGVMNGFGQVTGNVDNNGNGQAGRNGVSGQGGSAGVVSVTNSAPIAIYWNGSGSTTNAYGIYAASQGGTGLVLRSGNGSPNTGGIGGAAGAVSVMHTGGITLDTSNLAATVTGAAIGAFSEGGQGGQSADNSTVSGAGGNAGAVTVTANGTLLTQGTGLAGIRAASLGGGGGSGITNAGESTHNIDGGAGGNAGSISVTLQSGASISTNGTLAFGIGVLSAGGTGGAGNDFDDAFGTTHGSNGGNGGAAGAVTVTTQVSTQVKTAGASSPAIAAQSVGGIGGAAGDISKVLGATAGTAGSAGAVGTVTITNSGMLSTAGSGSYGILGQSIAASGAAGGTSSGLFYAQGGVGGAGGPGNTVTISHSGSIATTGPVAHGVLAQSIGGGGGAAGSGIESLVGLGGEGSGGALVNNGGSVTVYNTGSITTAGGPNPAPGQPPAGTTDYTNYAFNKDFAAAFSNAAVGILAQSIGGGGGDGGGSKGVITVGGSGASGGNGGIVTVNNNGSIKTAGQQSHGIVAQSIGGGGGNGGSALSVSPSVVTVAVGGSSGNGGAGGQVTVSQTGGSITTTGPLAAGIIAQSIAGGGGIAGAGNAYTVGAPIAAVAVAVGGSGGNGGTPGKVSVTVSNATLSTGNPYSPPPTQSTEATTNLMPSDSYGVMVQSIGGGGGKGGSSVAQALALALPLTSDVPFTAGASVSVGVGGHGGTGGSGNDAAATLAPGTSITTQGQGGHGVVVQSIGGGGGDGGASSALSATIGYGRAMTGAGNQVYTADVSVAVGGGGGASGDGAAATFISGQTTGGKVSISTYGDFADGVLVQSIGGGGGNGGTGSGTTQNWGSNVNASVGVGVGGSGKAGGQGGSADATLYSGTLVTTYGSSAHGIVAQSVGGGGGNSQGVQVSVGVSKQFSRNPDGNFIFSTPGANLTQGFNFAVTVGGNGSGGGDGGAVVVQNAAALKTSGGNAFGILAQSIGGGGGQGGSIGADASADNPVLPELNSLRAFVTNLAELNLPMNAKFAIGIGGAGGTGGDGGTVTVTQADSIVTTGDWSMGVVGQSIGGGGGIGGGSQLKGGPAILHGQLFVGTGVTISRDLNVQGKNGPGGQGGTVTINPIGATIQTSGYWAYGILAQSIGGGGGIGANGSDYYPGTPSSGYDVSTTDIYLGNNPGTSGSGEGGASGSGGFVNIPYSAQNTGVVPTGNTSLTVSTSGSAAHGVVLQSVGGGGGLAGAGNSNTGTAGSFTLTVGGGNAANGAGGNVSADSLFSITTTGQSAIGILAQSVGGGGGIAAAPSGSSASGVIIGGYPGARGGGGSASVVMEPGSAIATSGGGAHGIVAQSVGGGGGIAGYSAGDGPMRIQYAVGAIGGSGAGGNVSVTTNGTLTTTGNGAYGIIAQSVGNGGGLSFGYNGLFFAGSSGNTGGGLGGTVTVVQNGTLAASGANAVGIFAQSATAYHDPAASGGQVSITVNGSVSGGAGDSTPSMSWSELGSTSIIGGAGIWVDGGSNSNVLTITSGGSVTTTAGMNGTAIGLSGPFMLTVNNAGTVTGNIASPLPQQVILQNSGTFNAGPTINASVTNSGTVLLGGRSTMQDTTISGDYTQTEGGRTLFKADFNALRSDTLTIGGTASLAGHIQVLPTSLLPNRALSVITFAGAASTTNLVVDASALIGYTLSRVGNQLAIQASSANFAPAAFGLSTAQAAVASGLQSVWNAGGNAAFGTLFAGLSNAATAAPASYNQALDQLSPGASLELGAHQASDAFGFTNALLSCPEFASTTAQVIETNCAWARLIGRHTVSDGGGGIQGSTLNGSVWQIGGQNRIGTDLFLAGSLAFGNTWLNSDNRSVSGSGQTGYAGLALKWQPGPWLVAVSAMGSYGSFRTSRVLSLPGLTGVAKATPDQSSVAGRLRVAYSIWDNEWYVRPMASLDLVYSRVPSYRETGPAVISLGYDTASQTGVIATPAVEVGRRFDLGDGTTLRAFGSLGVSVLSNASWRVRTTFLGAPAGAGSFTTRIQGDRTVGRVSLGMQLLTVGRLDLRAQYDGDFAGSTRSHAGALTFALQF